MKAPGRRGSKIPIDLKWIFGSICVTEKGPVWTSQIPISSPDRVKFSRFDGFLSRTRNGSRGTVPLYSNILVNLVGSRMDSEGLSRPTCFELYKIIQFISI